jgi:hypothetical protein
MFTLFSLAVEYLGVINVLLLRTVYPTDYLTVTVSAWLVTPDIEQVILLSPVAKHVTKPAVDTVATEVLELFHVTLVVISNKEPSE